ncbi:hypothetical protein cypCar_00001119 [Cyprinus carpio]|nr:hypothetical protein cypCar_00001119 [Cyprinus carpio]
MVSKTDDIPGSVPSCNPVDLTREGEIANSKDTSKTASKDPCACGHRGETAVMNGVAGHDQAEEADSKQDGSADAEDANEQEVIVIQDTGFTVKIQAPGTEPFDLQVSPQEMVQEIHQVLMDREDTCHRTCFSLQLDGNVLDNFAELKSIEGLQEGSLLKVVEEPYTVREARIHVRHIRDLLKSLDPSDAYNGVDCNSLSFLSVFTDGDLGDTGKRKKKGNELEQIDCTPPEHILPGSKERPLVPLQPQNKDWKPMQCLKVLTMSGWNPPPGNRKMHGDLMYLYIVTVEDRHVSITASTRGFYLNQSTTYTFNPKPANPSFLSHSLVELLSQISAAFKKNFTTLQKKRVQRHPFERIATPFQVYSWTAPQIDHAMDCVRAEDAYTSRLGYEEHIPGQTRDWNEELQTTRELSRKNLPERLLRERAIFKVHSDFAGAATRGSMAVIDGNVMAINPGEETRMQMFIWNNIFFSLGFDVRDHYRELGGDAAAHVAPTNDLNGVRAYSAVDVEGLYTLGTVVVDYRGYRVTAQSIIPGILEREQEQSVIYGSIDFGKTVVSHPKYLELLEKTSRPLKVQRHAVLNEKDTAVELCSSVECKGIIGNDGRHYILDLLRTFPPDLNFLPVEGEELAPSYLLFMKMAALQLMQQKASKDKTAALHDTNTADAESESKPQALEASEQVPDGMPTSPTSSESTLTPDDLEATTMSEKSVPENQEAPADLKSEVPTANTNGTHEPSAAERQNGGCDSPLEGKEADENIPGLAQAKELAESLAAEDGSGIAPSEFNSLDALSNQQKAVLMSERVLGIEHPNTIQEYMHLALYCFANGHLSTALKLLYRARYLLLVVCGEDHPEMALLDSNIGLVLHGVMEYDLSLRFLENALAINSKYHGPRSLKVALSHHLVARVYESKAEFRSALQHEKEGYTIYKNQVGEAHEKTKESSEYLKYLTQQAVALQRTMNEIYKNGSNASIMPLKFTAPSMASVLEQLNIINGIIFIPLSQKDLENLKAEVQRRQLMQNTGKLEEQQAGQLELDDNLPVDD